MRDFIINEEKRKEELLVIQNFISHVPEVFREAFEKKYHNLNLYISFNHFIYTNDLLPESRNSIEFRPQGYFKDGTAFVWIPAPSATSQIHYSNLHYSTDFINRCIKILVYLEYHHKPKKWILDYRSNYGGYLINFINSITPFIKNFTVDVKTKSGEIIYLMANENEIYWNNPEDEKPIANHVQRPFCINIANTDDIHILINNRTASAGEISAYLFKKLHNATIHGFKSAGALSTVNNEIVLGVSISYPYGVIIDDEIIKENLIMPDYEGYNQIGV